MLDVLGMIDIRKREEISALVSRAYEEHDEKSFLEYDIEHDSHGASKAMEAHLEQSVTRYNYR